MKVKEWVKQYEQMEDEELTASIYANGNLWDDEEIEKSKPKKTKKKDKTF